MYMAMKLLHLLAVVLFLGNTITAIFWKVRADRSADLRVMAHTLEGIIQADRLFTLPGVVLLTIFGFGAAGIGRLPIFGTGWIFWSIVLFLISAAAYMGGVSPAQKKMAALARAATGSADFDAARYRSLSRNWNLWGTIALLAPIAATALMVLKPALPGI